MSTIVPVVVCDLLARPHFRDTHIQPGERDIAWCVNAQATPGPCEECGDSQTMWCCDDQHSALCQAHYDAMCRRMEADPIHCPLRSESMRWRPDELFPQGEPE